ncbi:uncharacterized protein LOC107618631 [Arachis ipaensis]|uniref:uncharacterized protein LOC107618631 n=1 Tax=Arachis ipaensis TaxID=130454 RepID=UPI0007AF9072|nr:uncharacterized protein LOC107618631 [Arachis ipaensis]XP_025676373.1 uncharacterized protein LOC112776427 isoform X1 [Arachis hypogaea]
MSLVVHSHLPLPSTLWKSKQKIRLNPLSSPSFIASRSSRNFGCSAINMNYNNKNDSSNSSNGVTWCFFNPAKDPIIQEALKRFPYADSLMIEFSTDETAGGRRIKQEPVAFLGGVFAGILRLDLNEEPLKEWITRTVEAAGISEEETGAEGSTTEAAPQEIQIE